MGVALKGRSRKQRRRKTPRKGSYFLKRLPQLVGWNRSFPGVILRDVWYSNQCGFSQRLKLNPDTPMQMQSHTKADSCTCFPPRCMGLWNETRLPSVEQTLIHKTASSSINIHSQLLRVAGDVCRGHALSFVPVERHTEKGTLPCKSTQMAGAVHMKDEVVKGFNNFASRSRYWSQDVSMSMHAQLVFLW